MNIRRKDSIICTAILVAGVLAALAVLYLRTTVPYWQCSEVYKRYHKVEGVQATYIKNFPLNDTLSIAVTLLEATDSAGWEYLLQEFKAPNDMVVAEKSSQKRIKVWTRLAPEGHPEERIDGGAQSEDTEEWMFDVVTISFEQRAVGIFDVNSMDEYIAMFDYNYNKNR